jgi:cell pole-organizing protein PopZ
MSLADVAARVRAASERNTVAPQREPPLEFRQQPTPAHLLDGQQAMAQLASTQAERPALQQAAPVPQSAPEPVAVNEPAETAFETPNHAPVAEPEVVEMEEVRLETPVAAAAPMSERLLPSLMEETQQSLLSQDAGLQIARSFEELAAAIDGAERRSLDEIAEDMLRPMLRDWLDDNLPTLVERLVREEIERVARGPRR